MAAGRNFSVQPYMFEPESDPEQEGASEEVVQCRLQQDVSEWCTCENCTAMPTEPENVCCREIPQVIRRLQNPPSCMVDHPGLEPVCLNAFSLQKELNIYRADYVRLHLRGIEHAGWMQTLGENRIFVGVDVLDVVQNGHPLCWHRCRGSSRVKWEDPYWFKLVHEGQSKSQAHSQTSEVTVYKINHQEGFKIEYSLTIVDTPGFGDTRGIERDKEITEQLRDLFSAELGVSEIDAVCFVAQATSAQLTPSQKYEIDSVLSIFDKDVAENIRVLVTFADGQRPPVLEAINAAGVPCPKTKDGLPVHFKFNNSALFADNKSAADSMSEDEEDGGFDQMFWNIGTKSLKRFFNALNVTETKSVTMKKKVLKERVRFESSILSNEVVISGTRNYLNTCQQCKFICHSSCRIPNDKIQCWAIGSNGRCTQCPGKCYWDKHFCQKYIWESEEEHIVKKLKNHD
ncbi:uncharacterized protein LOC127351395 [Dicentrarchus labrax]|uniref:uncharacterized protein LOC127351395 n=1 Tax=Dicentrarchus labrax TaxID=13489 RepID=UPI0021F528D5|nr:uncharacterized protein LOC127351395 [Dicentrarchus labrax]